MIYLEILGTWCKRSSLRVYRWVQEYAPILYQIWKKKHKKAYYKWRIDEDVHEIKGKWSYLYRAIDAGHTLYLVA